MEALSEWLASPLAGALIRSNGFVWPIAEMFHYLGMALLLGTVGFFDLRVLGVGKGISMGTLAKFVPLGVIGFVLNIVTGWLFVTGNPLGKPLDYLTNLAFQIKMLLVLLAGLNLLLFYVTGVARNVESMPAGRGCAARREGLRRPVARVLGGRHLLRPHDHVQRHAAVLDGDVATPSRVSQSKRLPRASRELFSSSRRNLEPDVEDQAPNPGIAERRGLVARRGTGRRVAIVVEAERLDIQLVGRIVQVGRDVPGIAGRRELQ